MLAFRAEFLDVGDFSGWFDLRLHPIKAELFGHRGGGTAVVAGEHHDLQPKGVEFADGFERGGFDRVGDGENSGWLAIDGHEHCRLAVFLKFHGRGFKSIQARDLFVPQEIRLADHHRATRDHWLGCSVIFSFRRKSGLPTITVRPEIVPTTPPAVTERKSFTASRPMPCSFAPCTIP